MKEILTQIEITKWERENKSRITGWEINYFEEFDTISFSLVDKTKVIFKRIKL